MDIVINGSQSSSLRLVPKLDALKNACATVLEDVSIDKNGNSTQGDAGEFLNFVLNQAALMLGGNEHNNLLPFQFEMKVTTTRAKLKDKPCINGSHCNFEPNISSTEICNMLHLHFFNSLVAHPDSHAAALSINDLLTQNLAIPQKETTHCEQCQGEIEMKTRTTFNSIPPQHLIIQLQRQIDTNELQPSVNLVESDVVEIKPEYGSSSNSIFYHLIGFVVHISFKQKKDTAGGSGHYIYFAKQTSPEDQLNKFYWHILDDDRNVERCDDLNDAIQVTQDKRGCDVCKGV